MIVGKDDIIETIPVNISHDQAGDSVLEAIDFKRLESEIPRGILLLRLSRDG